MKHSLIRKASPPLLLFFFFLGFYQLIWPDIEKPVFSQAERSPLLPAVLRFYINWQNTPYQFAGLSHKGIDCSGLVKKFAAQVKNEKWPQSTRALVKMGQRVGQQNLRSGDLLFFAIKSAGVVNHVGIYLDAKAFFHASDTRGVILSDLSEPYYTKYFSQARRL